MVQSASYLGLLVVGIFTIMVTMEQLMALAIPWSCAWTLINGLGNRLLFNNLMTINGFEMDLFKLRQDKLWWGHIWRRRVWWIFLCWRSLMLVLWRISDSVRLVIGSTSDIGGRRVFNGFGRVLFDATRNRWRGGFAKFGDDPSLNVERSWILVWSPKRESHHQEEQVAKGFPRVSSRRGWGYY